MTDDANDVARKLGPEGVRDQWDRPPDGGVAAFGAAEAQGENTFGSQRLIKATPFSFRDPSFIPRRQWLYGRHYIRGFVSATVAPGGVGKSALSIVEALAMASGRNLLGHLPAKPTRVWIWNGEDPIEELERRVAAAALRYNIKPADIAGRLFVDSGRTLPIRIAEESSQGVKLDNPLLEAIAVEIEARGIDVLTIDPFIASHGVGENDNRRIEAVVTAWTQLADRTGIAIELVHHTRKTSGAEATVEDSRGASALVAKARSVRVLNRMDNHEADKLGIDRAERPSLFRVTIGKANLAPPPAKSEWFKINNVGLGNGDDSHPQDYVGVVTTWRMPDLFDGVTVVELLAVQKAIAGKQYRKNSQAKDWIGVVVARVLGLDVEANKAKINAIINAWIASGALIESRMRDLKGNSRPVIDVGEWADGD